MHEVITVELSADGRGWIDGKEATLTAETLAQARTAALAHVARRAETHGRSLEVEAHDPDGRLWHLLVHPNGRVEPSETATARELTRDPYGWQAPAVYRRQTAAVSAAARAGNPVRALSLAGALEEDIAHAYGHAHPYIWRARELRAHAAYACELPAEACEEYMRLAHAWAPLDQDACTAAAQRAYACWHHITDTDRQAWLGEKLVAALRLAGDTAEPALRAVLRSVDELRSGVIV